MKMKTLFPIAGLIFALIHFPLALSPWSPCLQRRGTIDSLISAYFHGGHNYKTIYNSCVYVGHDFMLSMRQPKRRLMRLGLRRRTGPSMHEPMGDCILLTNREHSSHG